MYNIIGYRRNVLFKKIPVERMLVPVYILEGARGGKRVRGTLRELEGAKGI